MPVIHIMPTLMLVIADITFYNCSPYSIYSKIILQESDDMAVVTPPVGDQKPLRDISAAVVRFAGDSGDGMQLAGTQFTDTTAIVGNDVATLPDFHAEIRAPAGTVAVVSG